jgi:hypothetical protein
MENAPVQDAVVVNAPVAGVIDAVDGPATAGPVNATPKVSPAHDLREIQALIANGIFPGNVAPSVVKAYNLLEQMAQVVEKAATDAK